MDLELYKKLCGKSPEEAIRALEGKSYQVINCGDPQFVMHGLKTNGLPDAVGKRGDIHLIVASRGGTYSPRRDEVIDAYVF